MPFPRLSVSPLIPSKTLGNLHTIFKKAENKVSSYGKGYQGNNPGSTMECDLEGALT